MDQNQELDTLKLFLDQKTLIETTLYLLGKHGVISETEWGEARLTLLRVEEAAKTFINQQERKDND